MAGLPKGRVPLSTAAADGVNNGGVKRRQKNRAADVLHVAGPDVGRSLGDVISKMLGVARGEAEVRLLTGRVSVHGNACLDGDRRVRAGDVIHVRGEERSAATPGASATSVKPKIVFRDADLLIVDKPAGVTSVREPGDHGRGPGRDPNPTLDELLETMLGEGKAKAAAPRHSPGGGFVRRKNVKQSPPPRRVRPVHRLDRDTSGLMAFALSPEAASRLSADFKSHAIDRAYLAVVRGRLVEPRTITTHLLRDRGDGRRGSAPPGAENTPGAQRAVTHVRPVEHLGDAYTVVECRLETGRTHQIRIHLSEAGHPLCGDREYGRGSPLGRDESGAARQALHAYRLGLDHPITGERVEFKSDWPKDLASWLDGLQLRRS